MKGTIKYKKKEQFLEFLLEQAQTMHDIEFYWQTYINFGKCR
jgi:hypothetical protein